MQFLRTFSGGNMTSKQLDGMNAQLRDEIRLSSDSLLDKFPIERYLEMLDHYPAVIGYHYISPEVSKYTENILQNSSRDILEVYHKLLLVELISRNMDKVEKQELPMAIKQLYIKNFNRILGNISSRSEETGFYLYPHDKFFKELAVCTGKMIPMGAQKVIASTLPTRFIFKKGLMQFISGLSFILFKLHGIKPIMFNMHMDSHDPDLMKEYNPDGWIRFYINAANLLKLKKQIKGIYGTAWLFDPKLEDISPRLTYLRKIVVDNGGKLFYIGPSENGTTDALAKSPTRRKLYSEGKYVPTDYMIIWARQNLIDWANKVSSISPPDI
jgi:hypothetical protein